MIITSKYSTVIYNPKNALMCEIKDEDKTKKRVILHYSPILHLSAGDQISWIMKENDLITHIYLRKVIYK